MERPASALTSSPRVGTGSRPARREASEASTPAQMEAVEEVRFRTAFRSQPPPRQQQPGLGHAGERGARRSAEVWLSDERVRLR